MHTRLLFLIALTPSLLAMDYQDFLNHTAQTETPGKKLFFELLNYENSVFVLKKEQAIYAPLIADLYNFLKYEKMLSLRYYRKLPSIEAFCSIHAPEIIHDRLLPAKIMALENLLGFGQIVLPPSDQHEPLSEGFYRTDWGYRVEIYYLHEGVIGSQTPYGTIIEIN